MSLTPTRPPGRPNRKALAYESDIARLRSEGYSCHAIWEALLAVGVQLSCSSVKREVVRLAKGRPTKPQSTPAISAQRGHATDAASSAPSTLALTGKQIAAEWMKDRITNPLIRARMYP